MAMAGMTRAPTTRRTCAALTGWISPFSVMIALMGLLRLTTKVVALGVSMDLIRGGV